MAELFPKPDLKRPLADQLRPQNITDIVGQDHLLAPQAPLRRMLDAHHLSSMILWGPAGCGKTSLARLCVSAIQTPTHPLHFESLSAVFSGVADLRKIFEAAKKYHQNGGQTILFVDEIHRFNRAQQDGFLPYIEDGTIILIGATTENPSFELNGALLSRAQVFVLRRLDDGALETLLKRCETYLEFELNLDPDARETLKALADGDGRYLLNLIESLDELARKSPETPVLTTAQLLDLVQKRAPAYDKSRDEHYNLISALHKSLRGSDADAALYWCARMMLGGEDPHYILRRLLRFAIEDIGLADPNAMSMALGAWDTYDKLGSPEGDLALSQLVLYLGTAPKSNAAYVAHNQAQTVAKQTGSLMPPKHILNAPTKLMKQLGYNQGYQYDHNQPDAFSGQNYFPDNFARVAFYHPVERGFEREIKKRLDYWQKLRDEKA